MRLKGCCFRRDYFWVWTVSVILPYYSASGDWTNCFLRSSKRVNIWTKPPNKGNKLKWLLKWPLLVLTDFLCLSCVILLSVLLQAASGVYPFQYLHGDWMTNVLPINSAIIPFFTPLLVFMVQWWHQGGGGMEEFPPPVGDSAPSCPPPPSEKKMAKISHFRQIFLHFCPLRIALLPPRCPHKKVSGAATVMVTARSLNTV